MAKIRIDRVCECGNVVAEEIGGFGNQNGGHKHFVIYNHSIYICAECGKEMTRKIVKTEITETETEVTERN